MTPPEQSEWLVCAESPLYFLDNYAQVYDATTRAWVPFRLWAAQVGVLDTLFNNRWVIILKARQLGLTWLLLGYVLWLMLFRPAATALLFSKRDDEAIHLLDFRLKGMYRRLPDWMRARAETIDSKHEWRLSNGSMALAFPSTGGDSYTATIALVDEADLVPDLGRLLGAVKPTIDAGGQLVLLSRSDKSQPESEFKRVYRAAKAGENGWAQVFIPWPARPGRTPEWYASLRREILARTGSDDELHEHYPASDTEALAPKTLDKRIAPNWLEQCYTALPVLKLDGAPAISDLKIYRAPEAGRAYVIGADPAEGNPSSDDSALTVLDAETDEEVAKLAGKFQPATFGGHIDALGRFFGKAAVLCERNNHGHAVLLWLTEHSALTVLTGWDGKAGWLSNAKGKALLYDGAAESFRDGTTALHSFETYTQLASIDGSTLRAPDGLHDDLADSYALALAASRSPAAQILKHYRQRAEKLKTKESA